MTKHIHDELKCNLTVEDAKVLPELIDNSLAIATPTHMVCKPKSPKVKSRMVKDKVTTKKSRLEKATSHLYDLEDNNGPEKTLNIDFGLYQMEDF